MSKSFLFLLTIILVFSCHKNDDDDTFQEPEKQEYDTFEVDFYTSHKDFEVKEIQFVIVPDEYKIKPTHREGAIFREEDDIVLVKPEHRVYKIHDAKEIHLVQNAETNTIIRTFCYRFYNEEDNIRTIIPAKYMDIKKEVLVEDGNGEIQPAEYKTVYKEVVFTPAELIPVDSSNRGFQRIKFTIPCSMTIEEYLNDQILQHGIEDCLQDNSYQVVK